MPHFYVADRGHIRVKGGRVAAMERDADSEGVSGPLDIPDSMLAADRTKISLAGKDWLTEPEAAFYCGVSDTQFKKHAPSYGLAPRNFMGKKLYEKAELYRAIHGARLWSARPSTALQLGRKTGGFQPNLSGERVRPYKPRKVKPTVSE